MEVGFHLGIAPRRNRADSEPTILPVRLGELFELFSPRGFLSLSNFYLLTEMDHVMFWVGRKL